MKLPQQPSDRERVTQHIARLDPGVRKTVQAIREIILATDKEIGERIKWNNPSFYYAGEMPEFNAKEYKRELIVFNLHKGRVMLVLPSGARVDDSAGFLEGDYKDGRRLLVFTDMK